MCILARNDLFDTGHSILHAVADGPLMQSSSPLWQLLP